MCASSATTSSLGAIGVPSNAAVGGSITAALQKQATDLTLIHPVEHEPRSVTLIHPVQHEPHSASASLRLRSGPGIQPRRALGGVGSAPPPPPHATRSR